VAALASQASEQKLTDPGYDVVAVRAADREAALAAPREQVEHVVDLDADGVPVRLHRPVTEPTALVLHLHGGGFVFNDIDVHDASARRLANRSGMAVLSVAYRKPPEHRFPAAPDDVSTVVRWLDAGGLSLLGLPEQAPLLGHGDSAGANLALVTLLRIRDRLGMVDRVLGANLVFGVYDLRGTPSQQDDGGLPDMLSAEAIRWFHETYTPGLTDADRIAPDISPPWADLSGLPPALITVGGCDHLRDDSLFLAMRWAAAESPCELAVYPDSPHGFQALPTPMAQAAVERVHGFVGQRLATVG